VRRSGRATEERAATSAAIPPCIPFVTRWELCVTKRAGSVGYQWPRGWRPGSGLPDARKRDSRQVPPARGPVARGGRGSRPRSGAPRSRQGAGAPGAPQRGGAGVLGLVRLVRRASVFGGGAAVGRGRRGGVQVEGETGWGVPVWPAVGASWGRGGAAGGGAGWCGGWGRGSCGVGRLCTAAGCQPPNKIITGAGFSVSGERDAGG
jgi:hypothetical protein